MIFKTITDEATGSTKVVNSLFESVKRIKTVGFKNFLNTSEIDVDLIDQFNREIQETSDKQAVLTKFTQGTNQATADLIKSSNGMVISEEAKQVAINNTTVAAKASAVATKALSIAGNMFIGMAISWAISKAAEAIDHYVNRVKYAKEAIEETTSEIKNLSDEFTSTKKTTEEISKEFAELSQGVNQLSGENLTLNTEDYERFLELSNQLAELFPTLGRTYDENGNAIVQLSGDVDTIVGSLQNLVDVQRELTNQEIAKKYPELYEDLGTVYNQNLSELKKNQTNYDDYVNGINSLSNLDLDSLKADEYGMVKLDDSINQVLSKLNDKGYNFNNQWYADNNLADGSNDSYTLVSLDNLKAAKDDIKPAIDEVISEYNVEVARLSTEITTITNENKSLLDQTLQSLISGLYTTDYSGFTSEMQSGLQSMIMSFNWDELLDENGELDGRDIQQQMNLLIDQISKNGELKSKFVKLFSLEPGDLDRISITEQIQSMLDEIGFKINIMPYVQNESDAKQRLENSLYDITGFDHNSKSNQEEIAKEFGKLKTYTSEFDSSEIDVWLGIYDATKSAQENIELFEKTLKQIRETSEQLSFTDIISQIQTLSDGFDQLDKIYTDVYNKEDFDWSSILNNESFTETFGKLGDTYNDFIKTVSNAPNDLEACQEAFNNLVTDYIYSAKDENGKNIMGNLTEETKDATVAMLEQWGVVNALEVVEYQLARNTEVVTNAQKERNAICEELSENINSASDAEHLATLSSMDLENATSEEIFMLYQEATALGVSSEAITSLYLEKLALNEEKIDSSSDIDNLLEVANAAGITGKALSTLAGLKAAYNDAVSRNSSQEALAISNDMMKVALDAQEEVLNYKPKTKIEYGGGSSYKSASSSSNSSKDTAETIDFIEIKIENLQSSYDKLKDKAGQTFRTMTARANDYADALEKSNEMLSLQQQALTAYTQKRDSVGLSEQWAQQVRNGSINIASINDETLKNQISEYQQWNDKVNECKEAISDLKLEQQELVQDSIELVITKYDNLIDKVESANDRISKKIDLKEAWGFSASTSDYSKMNQNIQKQIGYNDKQVDKLKELQKTVKKGSEAWYEYQQRIDDTNASSQDLTLTMTENAQAAAALAKETADKNVEKLDSKDELTDAKIENATTAKKKNSLIDTEISRIDSRQKEYDKAYNTSVSNFNSSASAISSLKNKKTNTKNSATNKANKTYNSVLKKVKDIVKSGKRISQSLLDQASKLNDNLALYNACVQYNANYDAKAENKAIADLYKETSKQDKADLTMQKFDNVSAEYDYNMAGDEQKKSSINNQISLAEERGQKVSTAYYKGLISAETDEQNKLVQKRKALQDVLNEGIADGSIQKGSDEWYSMIDSINEVTLSIEESTQALAEYNNQMRQIRWDAFDDGMETVKRLNAETDYYIDLMSNKKLVDDSGYFTDEGNATLKLREVNLQSYLAQAEEYQKEYESILSQINKGELSATDENVIARMRELEDARRDSILAAEDEKKAVVDLVKEGYDKQLDSLSEMIEQYKELRQAEKDAYDYQKQIAEKTKNISALQKQLTAMGADTSEENKAQVQKLKVELEDAKSDLEETQYEKFISDSEEMLDEMYADYNQFISDKLADTDQVLNNIWTALGNEGAIVTTLKSLDSTLSASLTNAVNNTSGVDDITSNTVNNAKTSVETPAPATTTYSAEDNASSAVEAAKQKAEIEKQQAEIEKLKKQQYDAAMDYINEHVNKATEKKGEYSAVNQKIYDMTKGKVLSAAEATKLESILGIKHNNFGKTGNLYKKLKEIGIKGFAVGSKKIPYDQLALLGEEGAELQFDKSQGVLRQVGQGDKVFTSEMAENLWKMSQMNPIQFGNGVNLTPVVPSFERNIGGGDINIDMGGIVMNGVNKPEEFANELNKQLATNPKTIKLIQNQSVGALKQNYNSLSGRRF